MGSPITIAALALVSASVVGAGGVQGTRNPRFAIAQRSENRATPVAQQATTAVDDASINARLNVYFYFKQTLDWAVKRNKLNGALMYYRGSPTDYQQIAKYMIQTQTLFPDTEDDRDGSWKGDNRSSETFDEGCQGKAISLLSLMLHEFGDQWTYNHPVAGPRTMADTLRSALDCAYRTQYKPGDAGIPGPWPQSPGWRDGNVKVPGGMTHDGATEMASLRTYNDGATSEMLEGLCLHRLLLGSDDGKIDQAVLLCGEGTWMIEQVNNGAMPEQCSPDGLPHWGRGFEPPALSPRSTAYAAEIYMMCHAISGDSIWLEHANVAMRWINRTEVSSTSTWEHFLWPGSLQPVWGDDHFHLVWIRQNAFWPTAHFGALETYPGKVRKLFGRYSREIAGI